MHSHQVTERIVNQKSNSQGEMGATILLQSLCKIEEHQRAYGIIENISPSTPSRVINILGFSSLRRDLVIAGPIFNSYLSHVLASKVSIARELRANFAKLSLINVRSLLLKDDQSPDFLTFACSRAC